MFTSLTGRLNRKEASCLLINDSGIINVGSQPHTFQWTRTDKVNGAPDKHSGFDSFRPTVGLSIRRNTLTCIVLT